MSEFRPSTPARRPETARPRTASEHTHGEPEVVIDPPTADELGRMQVHLASLPVHAGAAARWEPAVEALIVEQPDAGPSANHVAMPRWPAAEWRERLAEVARLVRRTGAWPSMLVSDELDQPTGLGELLRGIGWHPVQRETVLWVGRASVIAHLDPRMRIEAVQPRHVATHEAVEREIFGLHDGLAGTRRGALEAALASGSLRAYLVRVEDQPVAVARLSQGEGVAGLYALGVRDGWRGRGYGTLLTTVATRAGMATGNRIVWLSVEDGNDVARHVYEKLHFRVAFSWARWLAPPDR